MHMKDTINWGIIAPGRIAHKFAHDLQLVENARLHAVASRSWQRASDFAREYHVPHAFGSYDELLSCPDLDVVYIASPHSEHYAHTLMCLENRIPVLCEKPLAMNSAQVRQMIATAQANEVFFMEAIWTRFIPVFEETKRLVGEGIIGGIKTVRADFGFRAAFPPEHRLFNMELGGGALLDVGIYPIFFALSFLGKPDVVQATAVFGETGADDSCAMLFSYNNGSLAILDSSLQVKTDTEAFLYGEKGTLKLHSRFHHAEEMSISFYDKPSESMGMKYTGHGYFHEIVEVMDCLKKGKNESEKLPHRFSLEMMEVLDWVRREAGIVYGVDSLFV